MDNGLWTKRGFTLIEIMVSIGILSFGLILILQGFTQSLNVLRICRNNLKITLLAEEKITEIQIKVKQDKDLAFQDLNKVMTTVSWKEGRRKGAVPLVTYLRTPPNE